MALINCPECGKEMSDSLNKCPHCGYKVKATYTMYYEGDYVNRVHSLEVVDADSKDVLDYFEKSVKETYKELKSKYSGYSYKVTNDGSTVTSDATIDYSEMDLDAYVKDNSEFGSYVKDGKVLFSKLKTLYQSMGATCK